MTDNTEKQTADAAVTNASVAAPKAEATPEKTEKPDKKVEIIGVRFKQGCKTYYFAAGKAVAKVGDSVIVDTARGQELVTVALANKPVSEKEIVQPLRPVIRVATQNDLRRAEENHRKEAEAYEICKKKIAEHKLDMNLVGAEYTFDNAKLLFYFTSDGRVDFRDLVKDLASVFCTRIELRQIGIRDEAKLCGGLGVCGRPFCCSTFLSDFAQVSIKMAKEQNFSLNSAKISGACGRLMCCLRFEHETYEEAIRRTPPMGATVQTSAGKGVIVETSPLMGFVKVKLEDKPEAPRAFPCEEVTVLFLKNKKPPQQQASGEAKEPKEKKVAKKEENNP